MPAFVPEHKKKLDRPCPHCGRDTLYKQKGYSFISKTYLYIGWVEICEDPDETCGWLDMVEKEPC